VIDQRFKARGVEILLACQIDQDAGIEISTAGPHDRSAGWGQAHAGVNGMTALDGGDANAIAEMRDDEPIRRIVSELAHNRLAGKAVKSIALDATRSQFLGEGKGARDIRHPSVKRRIEAGNLWQLRKMLLREANDRQRRRIVQRREGGCCFELTQHGVVDQAMATKIRPTVHYAMPDRDRLGLSTVREKPPDARDRVPMGSEICRFGSQRIVISVSRPKLASRPPIDSASPREASSGWKIRPGKVRT